MYSSSVLFFRNCLMYSSSVLFFSGDAREQQQLHGGSQCETDGMLYVPDCICRLRRSLLAKSEHECQTTMHKGTNCFLEASVLWFLNEVFLTFDIPAVVRFLFVFSFLFHPMPSDDESSGNAASDNDDAVDHQCEGGVLIPPGARGRCVYLITFSHPREANPHLKKPSDFDRETIMKEVRSACLFFES